MSQQGDGELSLTPLSTGDGFEIHNTRPKSINPIEKCASYETKQMRKFFSTNLNSNVSSKFLKKTFECDAIKSPGTTLCNNPFANPSNISKGKIGPLVLIKLENEKNLEVLARKVSLKN